MQEYDRFLDENDRDIYYWATQGEPAETARPDQDTPTETWRQAGAKSGEWVQTVGAFKAAYRPVPSRWADSEILALLHRHVRDNSANGFNAARRRRSGMGLGRMPNVRVFN